MRRKRDIEFARSILSKLEGFTGVNLENVKTEIKDYINGKAESNPDEKIFYSTLNPMDKRKKVSLITVATIFKLHNNKILVSHGVAFCSFKETYNRRIGNKIAKGRAKVRPTERYMLEKAPLKLDWKALHLEMLKIHHAYKGNAFINLPLLEKDQREAARIGWANI